MSRRRVAARTTAIAILAVCSVQAAATGALAEGGADAATESEAGINTETRTATVTEIEEVTVIEKRGSRHASQPAFVLDTDVIREMVPIALTDVFHRVQSVGIRTNSRGEAVLRLRGSEERQTGIFLDGAPLSVPWDGRVDLSALPAGIVKRVKVTASAAPIEFGTHTTLGSVEIQSPAAVGRGLRNFQAAFGTQSAGVISALMGVDGKEIDWLFAGGYRTLAGENIASRSAIPYGRERNGYRVNTDLDTASAFVAATSQPAWGAYRVSLLSVDAGRGIASQGHLSPQSGSARYWRYPDWRFNQMTWNSRSDFGESLSLMTTGWLQHFEQTIEQFTDDRYVTVESTEEDLDRTAGARLIAQGAYSAFDLQLFANAQVTEHRQIDSELLAGTRGLCQEFQQNVFSVGAEIDAMPRDALRVSAAMAYDLSTTPKTGDRDAQDQLDAWSHNVAARWFPTHKWEIAATLGRRTRFPSLREMYGEALGEFLLNPDLRPETATLADLTVERSLRGGNSRLRVTPWLLRIDDTLSRRNVTIDGVRYRQRYNMNGSKGEGLEIGLDWRFDDRFELRVNGTWQDLETRMEDDGTRPVLYQRPDFQGAVTLDYLIGRGWDLFMEAEYLGVARDEDDNGNVVDLPASWHVGVRLFRTLQADSDGRWRAFVGIDNATNDVVLPQLGLPQPGRTLSLGVVFDAT